MNRMLKYHHGLLNILQQALEKKYHRAMTENCAENVVNIMTNEFPTSAAKKTYASCVFLEKEGKDYRVSENFEKMLEIGSFIRYWKKLWSLVSPGIR